MADNEFINDGELPFSLEAEQAVLGSILLDPSCLTTVSLVIKTDYFYLPEHREIFKTMLLLDQASGEAVDPLLVLNMLKENEIFSDERGKNYLIQLMKNVPSTTNVEAYARIIKEKYYVRSLIVAARKIIDKSTSSADTAYDLLNFAESQIYNIRQGQTENGPTRLSEITPDVFTRLYQITSDEKEKYAGLKTGFEDLDRVTTGLNKSDLVIVGARPAMGKTSFALNMATNVARKGKKVVFFSLEMSKEQLAQRVIASEARVEVTKMRSGRFEPSEWQALSQATMYLADFDLYFDDSSDITVPEIKARIRRMKGVDCIFIDYLQLMKSSEKKDNRVQEVSDITRGLKLMAKDLKVPVVTLAQLSRGTDARGSKSHKPQLSDLRESGSIEQDADIVMMLYRDTYYSNGEGDAAIAVNDAQLLVQKNRHGPTKEIELTWIPEFTPFTTKARDEDEG